MCTALAGTVADLRAMVDRRAGLAVEVVRDEDAGATVVVGHARRQRDTPARMPAAGAGDVRVAAVVDHYRQPR
jgi:hypothetical protein